MAVVWPTGKKHLNKGNTAEPTVTALHLESPSKQWMSLVMELDLIRLRWDEI
jgi:hypothetical protein